jgi:hypothetical protein
MDENQKPLAAMLESINIAESLDEAQLLKIGRDAFAGYDLDEQSRIDWVQHVDEWTKLAKQTVEPKISFAVYSSYAVCSPCLSFLSSF